MSPLEIGNYLHYDSLNGGAGTKLPSDLAAMYPQTDFRFARRGEAGVDVEVVGGIHPSDTSVYPGHTGLQMPTMVTLNPILLLDGRNFKNKLEIKGMILTLCFCPMTRKLDNYYFEDD